MRNVKTLSSFVVAIFLLLNLACGGEDQKSELFRVTDSDGRQLLSDDDPEHAMVGSLEWEKQ